MKLITLITVVVLAISLSLRADAPSSQPAKRTTESGLQIIDVKTIDGALTAEKNDVVWVHYTGKLENGKTFDSSFQRRDEQGDAQPIKFHLGAGNVIKGWDEGIVGMKVGEKRQFIIPPALAYGAAGAGDAIPPNETLKFDVELVGIYRETKELQNTGTRIATNLTNDHE
jgi:peptidylprolyl isomerase